MNSDCSSATVKQASHDDGHFTSQTKSFACFHWAHGRGGYTIQREWVSPNILQAKAQIKLFSRDLDTSQIPAYANHLTSIGVKGVYILGTTGEGFSLTLMEKVRLVRSWAHTLDKQPEGQRLLAIVNVSSTVVHEALELASHVEELGLDGIALLPPIYYQYGSVNELVAYCKLIVDRVPTLPLLYYHIPFLTGELKCKYSPIQFELNSS